MAIRPGGLRTPSEHLQVGIRRHVGLVHTRQTGVRLQRDLVETIGQEAVLVLQVLREHPEYLLRQVNLAHAIPVVERPIAPQHRYMVENTWVLAQSRIDLNSSQ